MTTFRLARPGIRLFQPSRIFFLLWMFTIVFPKGGFKLSGVPITWGYLLIGMLSVLACFKSTWKVQTARYQSFLFLVPFQLVSLSTIFINGIEEGALGMTLSFLISFFLLPIACFLIFSDEIETLDLPSFFSIYKKGIFFIACYGIFLFFFKQISGKFIEIPFLTTNWSDLGELENKHINRGAVFKLISTYNNGNIFGICLTMLLPLYCYLEESSYKRWIVKCSLLMTLSRTVWIGLILNELFYNLFVNKNKKTLILNILLGSLFILSILIGISNYYGFAMSFFLDASLGGRSHYFDIIENAHLFSDKPFVHILEIVYLGVLDSFGFVGLFTFILAMTGSIFSFFISRSTSQIQTCIWIGLINYLILSGADGAILFIPTMAIFWFLSSLLLRNNLYTSTH